MSRGLGKRWVVILLVTLVMTGVYYYPLPYFVSHPGEAIDLAPLVAVEGGFSNAEGSFLLTTIRMGNANLLTYAWARWNDYVDLIEKEPILSHFDGEEEYRRHQLESMEISKDSAIIAAYQLADHEVEEINKGVLVTHIQLGMPAREKLQIGDVITQVDGQKVTTAEEMLRYLQDKEVGDVVTLTVLREEQEEAIEIPLAPLSNSDVPRAGLGIGVVTEREIDVEHIEIRTDQIGGPSAGLMFALEIYNQLTEDDLTKGYRIAGTGTIDAQGEVGPIGGVHQKVVAAHRAQADLFFVPREGGRPDSNYQRAKEAAIDIGTSMEIVPVDTLQDAVDYLRQLPEKRSAEEMGG